MDIQDLLAQGKPADIVSLPPDTTLRETAQTLIQHQIGAAVIVDEAGRLLGIVSERDLVPVVANYTDTFAQSPVTTIMSTDVITCAPHDEVAFVLRLMQTNAIRHMPVVKDGKLLTMLSIRALATAYEHLQIEANTDPLTAVSNRRPFLKMLRREFDSAQLRGDPFSVAMLDIDHFKQVNDTFGHDVGDRVLQDVSSLLIEQFRSIDLVGRLGGEEFALVFPRTDTSGAQIACERIRTRIRKTGFKIDEKEVQITVSIGLAARRPETLSDTALLKQADVLLYQAKKGGRDRVIADHAAAT